MSSIQEYIKEQFSILFFQKKEFLKRCTFILKTTQKSGSVFYFYIDNGISITFKTKYDNFEDCFKNDFGFDKKDADFIGKNIRCFVV